MMHDPDWSLAIQDLISAGYTEAQIAKQVGTTQPTIHYLKTGASSDVKYRLGVRLVLLCSQSDVSIKQKDLATTNS